MAQRRMFSKSITESDEFLDMSLSTQALYFHLGMQADDEGFVSPGRITRMIGSNPDELKVLGLKKFIIPFESGVIVIRHWHENNYLQKDRTKDTLYINEAKNITREENVYKLYTECTPSIGEDRIGKDRIGEVRGQKNEKVDKPVDKLYPDGTILELGDGTKALKRFGIWVDPNNINIQISRDHYKELP